MAGRLFHSAVALLAASLSGCAMCDHDDYGPPVAQDQIDGVFSPTGRVGSVLSGPTVIESQHPADRAGSVSPAGSGTRFQSTAR